MGNEIRKLLKLPLKFKPDQDCGGEQPEQYREALGSLTRASDAYASIAGTSFGGGIYRLYDVKEVNEWTQDVVEVFPDYAGRIACFGRDWLCNQFCLDRSRTRNHESLILLFEIATGQVLKIPMSFKEFHEELLIEDADAAVAEQMFVRWRLSNPDPLTAVDCVGYKVPLFLGGTDDVENLERTLADLYWTITGQLLNKSRQLPLGTPLGGVGRAPTD